MEGFTTNAYEPLWAELDAGAAVVTANAHAARQLQRAWARRQLARGHACWETPRILPWDVWLDQLWTESALDRQDEFILIGDLEAECLWESIISSDRGELIDVSAAARAARMAWQRLHEYGAGHGGERWRAWRPQFQSEDAQAFLAWADLYARQLKANRWLDASTRLARLDWPPPAPEATVTIGYGFLHLTPAQERIRDLRRMRMQFWPAAPRRHERTAAEDAAAEARAAAAWARRRLESDREARIAILAPDLAPLSPVLERELLEALAPEQLAHPRETRAAPFAMSLGRPLSHRALVLDALAFLRLRLEPCTLADAGRLLRSIYCTDAAEEFHARQRLESELRQRRWVEFGGEAWIRLLRLAETKNQPWRCPRLRHGLEQAAAVSLPNRAAPSAWRVKFSAILNALGWPGERLDSDTHQAAQAWRELLDDFGRLDRVLGSVAAENALRRLERMADERIHQPEQPDARLEVLGMYQMAGLRFDALRVIGLSDRIWPPPARPLPFLPPRLQRSLHMPNATPQQACDFASALMQRLQASAPDVVFSYPRREADVELAPSPLLQGLEPVKEPLPAAEWVFDPDWMSRDPLESYTDAAVAAAGTFRGGVNLFKAQARCPFRGFAEIRLGAAEYEVPELGWGRRDQGILAHWFLDIAWRRLCNSDGLRQAIEGETLGAIVAECRRELESGVESQGDRLARTLNRLELDRLGRLVRDWLTEVEAQRPWFRVLFREKPLVAEIGGIQVKMRVDRLDEHQDGRQLIVDYKTGDNGNVKDWSHARPDEPQLPLYLTLAPPPAPSALAFASLRRDRLGLSGCGTGPNLPEGVKFVPAVQWEEQVRAWHGHLQALALEFAAGVAELRPKTQAICDDCHLHPLCRVRALHSSGEEEDSGAAEAGDA